MLTKVQAQMLFAVGICEEMHTQRLVKKPLRPALSKAEFIRILRKSGLDGKSPRAIYRTLQLLEEDGYLYYHARELMLTVRGMKAFARLKTAHLPYLRILTHANKLVGQKFKTALAVV